MTGTQKSEIDLDLVPAILAAEARGEPIRPEDAELLRRAEQDDPELRSEAPLWAAIGRLGDARGDGRELSDAAMLQQVLARARLEPGGARLEPRGARVDARGARLEAAPESTARPRAAPRPMLRRGIAGSLAGVAVAATLLAALAAELFDEPAHAPPTAPSGNEALDPSGARRTVLSLPTLSVPEAPPPGAGAPTAEPSPGAGALSPGTGAPSPDAGAPTAEPPSGASAPAAEPSPGAGAPTGEPAAASAVGARDRAQPPPRPRAEEPATGPQALLLRAQAQLGQGKSAEANAAYRALLAQHPGSPEARAALVSLGQIALHQGKAAEALGYFDRYLAGAGGPLAAEARVGRVQCLRRLGRAADERAAIADFLARHGESVHAPRLRARLSELGGR
ncbi:tetratricopeptide repeat protein [Sorangium atrum]|uniref:Tetratricopeptide repeat protein n=1 Tax=Sorangium atrum TaxID=2995308 RepID=A0ABT5CDS8_9BACT|nr:tetratricopeptide repeat protein [Sorangium aterium]MDC0684093.1 tetratricopeptide repeat protein [Sorangium aterium]